MRRCLLLVAMVGALVVPVPAGAVVPGLGQHTEELLAEAGYTSEEVAALRRGGAV